MNEAEYIATREQREPLLKEILEGYVPRRIDGLRERLPLEIFVSAYRQIVPVTAMIYRDAQRPHQIRVINEIPRDLARKAEEALWSNPHYRHNGLQSPDWPDNMPHTLSGWEGLAHPVLFKRLFTHTREFLDGMYDYLRTYVPELK